MVAQSATRQSKEWRMWILDFFSAMWNVLSDSGTPGTEEGPGISHDG